MITNFPNGVSSFGIPIIGAGPIMTTGRVLFADNAHPLASDSPNGGTKERPFRTIDYAIGQCAANAADHIIVGPAHVETLSGAGQLTLDVAGVSIIGVGNRGNRPTIALGTDTAANVLVSAANCRIENVLFTGNVDNVSAVLTVNANNFTLRNCGYRDVVGQCSAFLVAGTNSDGMLVEFLDYVGDNAGGTVRAINLVGSDRSVIRNCYFDGNFSTGVITCTTTAVNDLIMHDIWARNRNSNDVFLVDTVTGSTGLIGPNINIRIADNAANITEALNGATFVYFDPIMVVNAAGERGLQWNGTASADA